MSILSAENKFVLIGVAVAGLGLYFVAKKASGAAGKALDAINPMNNDNIINQGATSIYQAVTGSTGTIGGDIYDITHPTYDGNGKIVLNVPGQPGYDKTKTATDMSGSPDRIAGYMEKITSFVWGDV